MCFGNRNLCPIKNSKKDKNELTAGEEQVYTPEFLCSVLWLVTLSSVEGYLLFC